MKKRLTGAERKMVILDEASRLFAFRGLHGTTTKMIAKASGISEPVLYQHFKNKEDIYAELELMCSEQTAYFHTIVKDQKAGPATLILITYLLINVITFSKSPGAKSKPTQAAPAEILLRLMGFSFLEEGRFARSLVENCIGAFFEGWAASYKACAKEGALTIDSAEEKNLWLVYQLIIGAGLFNLPSMVLIEDLSQKKAAIQDTTLFALRGLGLKNSIIAKHVNWRELEQVYTKAFIDLDLARH